MNRSRKGALCFTVAFALLGGCGGSQLPIGAPRTIPQSRAIAQPLAHGSKTFNYTGSEQYFKVPRNVTNQPS